MPRIDGTLLDQSTHEVLMMHPGAPEVVHPYEALASASEVREKLGLGVNASLKAVLELAPTKDEAAAVIYVFDRGPDPDKIVPLVSLPSGSEKRTPLLQPGNANRYLIVTDAAIRNIHDAASYDLSYAEQAGWQVLGLEDRITIGANEESKRLLGSHVPPSIGQQHVAIGSHPDGSLSFMSPGPHETIIHLPAERDRSLDIWG